MRLRSYVEPIVIIAVLGVAAYAAYRTQDRWMPVVFPQKAAKSPEAKEGEKGTDEHDHSHEAKGDRVKLSAQAQKNLILDVDSLTPQDYWRTMLIPGVVVDRPGESDRGVTSKVAGVIMSIRARPGATVRTGDPLFTIQLASEFLQSAQTDLAKTAKELEFANIELNRVDGLVKKDVIAGAELLKQKSNVGRLTTQLNGARRQLQVFGLNPEQVNRVEKGELITEITVVAPGPVPAQGASADKGTGEPTSQPLLFEVQELKVALGEQVTAGQALCLLANHQNLFIEGRAFKSEADSLASAVEKKIPVKVEFSDDSSGQWKAQEPLVIHHLSNQVDAGTRTLGFYLPLYNEPRTFERDGKTHFVWRYRPGQRVRIRVPVQKLITLAADGKTELHPFVVPAGAVVREGPEAFVFVQSGDVFIRKPIHVLFGDRTEVVFANDGSVTDAEFVVRNQAAAINRALKAQSASGGGDPHAGHSHD